jgi:hypothetical protein
MSRTQKIRYVAALLLVLLVSMPPALTAAPMTKGGFASSLCHLLLSLWEKEGSSLDPDGKLTAGLRSCAKADEGASLDPSGRRTATADEGSSLDPNGLRSTKADAGSSLDPSGRGSMTADAGSSLDPDGRP